MAFNASKMDIKRSFFNDSTLSLAQGRHFYQSTDSISAILSSNYFPNYLGGDQDSVKIGDILSISVPNSSLNLTNTNYPPINLNFSIASVNPLTLIKSGEVARTTYTNVAYSGSSSGTLNFEFSRDANDNVYFYVPTTKAMNLTVNNQVFTLAFNVPTIYQPDYTMLLASTVTAPVVVNIANQPNVAFGINFKIGTGIVINQMPDKPFGAGTIITLQNISFFYKGSPLV